MDKDNFEDEYGGLELNPFQVSGDGLEEDDRGGGGGEKWSGIGLPPPSHTNIGETSNLREVSPVVCTLLWIFLGICMILFNKMILAPQSQGGWNFGYPFFLTMCHQIFATIATFILERFTPLLESVKTGKLSRKAYWSKVTPLALFFSLGLVLGNSAYKYLSVSYIQMIKSCLPIPTLFVASLLGRERPSIVQVTLVVLICLGAIIASLGEMRFSLIGFALQGSALFADVFRMLFLDLLTIEVKLDNLSTLYYMAPLASVFIFIGFVLFEYDTFNPYEFSYVTADTGIVITESYPSYFFLLLLANAVLAFALNLSIVLFVSNMGIMSMTLAGIFKDVLVILLSVLVFGRFNTIRTSQYIGYGLSLMGLTLYKEYKRRNDSALVMFVANDIMRWCKCGSFIDAAEDAESLGHGGWKVYILLICRNIHSCGSNAWAKLWCLCYCCPSQCIKICYCTGGSGNDSGSGGGGMGNNGFLKGGGRGVDIDEDGEVSLRSYAYAHVEHEDKDHDDEFLEHEPQQNLTLAL